MNHPIAVFRYAYYRVLPARTLLLRQWLCGAGLMAWATAAWSTADGADAPAAMVPADAEIAVLADPEPAPSPTPDPLAHLKRQVELEEYQPTLVEVEQIIKDIESRSHRYDMELAEPLLIRGDIRYAREDFAGALDDYSRSVHVQRVNNGLHHSAQIEAVYREAMALKRTGQMAEANRREEYAYEVLRKHHGAYAPEILPGLYHLADWHQRTNNVFAARRLYGQAVLIVESSDDEFSPQLIKPLQGLAETYRKERFPPFYSSASRSTFSVGSGRSSSPDHYNGDRPLTLNNFPAGELALKRIVRIRELEQASEPVELAEAIIDLADWNLLFDKYRTASQLYQHAQILLSEAHKDATVALFSEPQLLHFPMPQDPPQPSGQLDPVRKSGYVRLGYVITNRGTVTQLQTLESQPAGLMDFRVRKSMRAARFRPPLVNGELIEVSAQTYEHKFHYYPKENEKPPQESNQLGHEAEPKTAMVPALEPNQMNER